jgi:hypothetical protein
MKDVCPNIDSITFAVLIFGKSVATICQMAGNSQTSTTDLHDARSVGNGMGRFVVIVVPFGMCRSHRVSSRSPAEVAFDQLNVTCVFAACSLAWSPDRSPACSPACSHDCSHACSLFARLPARSLSAACSHACSPPSPPADMEHAKLSCPRPRPSTLRSWKCPRGGLGGHFDKVSDDTQL